MDNYFLYTLIALFMAQFFFPMLAGNVKKRFKSHGFEMESNKYLSVLNLSGFWREASDLNRKVKDKDISHYLLIYYLWWLLVWVSILGVIVSNK